MITRNGTLYGFIAGGWISNGGVIYRINRDGSGYQLAYNPDQRATFIGNPIEAPDGTVYGILTTGLYQVDSIDTGLHPVDPFGAYTRAENLQFIGQDLYGVVQWGNGRGQIFRYVMPSTSSGSAGTVAVHDVINEPSPLTVPSDSPEPAQVLFADVTLPALAKALSGQTQQAPAGKPLGKTQQANKPTPKPAESKEPDKPSAKGDEIIGKA